MSLGLKSSLAALAVSSLLFAPIVGTGIAYADDTSTGQATAASSSSPGDDQGKKDDPGKSGDDQKAKEDPAPASTPTADNGDDQGKKDDPGKSGDDQKAKPEPEETAKKAAEEPKAEETAPAENEEQTLPSSDPSPSTESSPSPSAEATPGAKTAAPSESEGASYNAVETYVTKVTLCEAGGVDIKAGAPDINAKGPGDAEAVTYHAGDELRWDTSASSIDVYLAIADDPSNNTTLTIAVKQGEECKIEVTPTGTTQVGNVVTVPNDNGVIYRDQDGKYLEPGDYTLTADKPTLIVKAEPDQFYKLPAGDWTWTHKYQAPDADKDGYADAEEQAAGSDPNDPKSTPVDLDGDGVLNDADAFPNDPNESADADKDGVGDNADKCAGTAADAVVNADGCSADQLGDKPDAVFPQDPKYNNTDTWEAYFGNSALCVKFEPVSTPYTVPTNPSGYSWFSAIVKAGSGDAANELYNGVKPGDKLVHSSGKDISHVILCKRAVTAQYKYGTGLYFYKKLNPSKPASWENSGIQRFVTSKEGTSDQGWFTSISKLPDYVCGPGWAWQQDKQRVGKGDTIVWPNTITYPVDNIGWPPIYDAKHGEMNDLGVKVPDCTTYYDAPTIRVWDQKCVAGDQYTDGGFAVTASDKVTVVVKDSDGNVVTDPSHVKPGVYTVFSTAPKGGGWNTLPDGWSYVGESKTVIKTVVTVAAAEDCSVPKPANPTVTATCLVCAHQGQADGAVRVTVTNTADDTKATVVYTATVSGESKTVTVKDGESGDLEFDGLAAGDYTVTVKGDDKTSAETSVTVKDCPVPPKPLLDLVLKKYEDRTCTKVVKTLTISNPNDSQVNVFVGLPDTPGFAEFLLAGGESKTVSVPKSATVIQVNAYPGATLDDKFFFASVKFSVTKVKDCSDDNEYNPPTSQGPGLDDGIDPFTSAGVVTMVAAGLMLAIRRRFTKQ